MLSKQLVKSGALGVAILGTLFFFAASAKLSLAQNGDANPNNNGQAQNPNQEILQKLSELENKIDALGAEQVTATFCISQGRELGIGAEWAFTAPVEWEGGLGWAEVGDVKVTWSPSHPAPIPTPLGIPIILPSEFDIGIGGSLGRNMDICIDIPIEMGPTDTALIAELATDINAKANDFPNRGKFQRRAHRLLNYTKRRIPGIQTRTASASSNFSVASEPEQGAEDEFDRIDEAVENLLASGIKGDGSESPFGILREQNVRNLVVSFSELPVDISNFAVNPEQIFDPMSKRFSGSFGDLSCDDYGIDTQFRINKPGLNNLCERLENLPDFDQIESVLSGDMIADLFDAIDALTITSSAANVSSAYKTAFCKTIIGRRAKFDTFCSGIPRA